MRLGLGVLLLLLLEMRQQEVMGQADGGGDCALEDVEEEIRCGAPSRTSMQILLVCMAPPIDLWLPTSTLLGTCAFSFLWVCAPWAGT